MRFMVVGGAGEVGRYVTRELARAADVERVLVVDIDGNRSRETVEEIDAGKVEVAVADVRDRSQLVQLARDSHVLVNCTPFPWFENVFNVAVEARVAYMDLMSTPTDEQRRRAAAAGIVAVSGIGLTPGTTNVLCAAAHCDLDAVDELHVHWVSLRTIAPSQGLLDAILWELRAECPARQYFQNGRYVPTRPLEGTRVVTFPEPVGDQRVSIVPDPAILTLPRNFPDLKFVAVRGTWSPELMSDMLVLDKYGLLDDEQLGPGMPTAIDATRIRIWGKLGGRREGWGECAYFAIVEAVGRIGGVRVVREYRVWHEPWGDCATGRMTGTNAAVGALLFARHGTGDRAGFVDPEMFFDPGQYLDELTRRDGIRLATEERVLGDHALEHVL